MVKNLRRKLQDHGAGARGARLRDLFDFAGFDSVLEIYAGMRESRRRVEGGQKAISHVQCHVQELSVVPLDAD